MSVDPSSTTINDAPRKSMIRLGQRLRQIRLNRNFTQGDVARDLFSVSYVSAVERGLIRPSLGALEYLAERLEVPLVDLVTEGDVSTRSSAVVEQRYTAAERHREKADRALQEARILTYQNRSEEAVARLLGLDTAHLTMRQTATLHLLLATCYNQQGRAEEARQVTQAALPEAERAGEHDLVVRLRCELGRACALQHDHASALEQYQLAEHAFQEERVRDPAVQLRVLLDLGGEYQARADREQAIATLTRARDVAKELEHPEVLGAHYWTLSQTITVDDNAVHAQHYAARSLAAYEDVARHHVVTSVYTRLGMALFRAGRPEEALVQLQRANTIASERDDLEEIAQIQSTVAQIYLQQKRNDVAHQAAQAAREAAERLADVSLQVSIWLIIAHVEEERQHLEEATTSYERVIDLLQEQQQTRPVMPTAEQVREAYAQFSEYLERQGESQRAYEMLKLAYRTRPRG